MDKSEKCKKCKGRGYISVVTGGDVTQGGATIKYEDCPHCGGSGEEPPKAE